MAFLLSLLLLLFSAFVRVLCCVQSESPLLSLSSLEQDIPPLVDFQVHEPVFTPTEAGSSGCVETLVLMDHVFANSYGTPFVGSYTPPSCDFNRVTMNFTVTSQGRQFDRLGLMYLGDIEVFRTSTAEPTPYGIVWTYIKEMQQYNALWKTDQKIIFDLPNLVNDEYTGLLNTTLTATFFTVSDTPPVADAILPISAEKSSDNEGSAWQIPDYGPATISHQFPPNVERAVVSLSACGQQAEEFWYTNVFNSDIDTFESTIGTLDGYSPFREVQLLIDGSLAGVSWPFPVIFTGGVVPGLWRPIVGIDAFDLRQDEIDITPWLPLLCDGAPHTFEIKVVGLNDDGSNHATLSDTVDSYWVVTGTIFLFLNPSKTPTTGTDFALSSPPPQIRITSSTSLSPSGSNSTLTYTTSVTRSLNISSSLTTTTSGHTPASWTQQLTYTNLNLLLSDGYTQQTILSALTISTSSSDYSTTHIYPLSLNTTFTPLAPGPEPSSFKITGSIYRHLSLESHGPAIFPTGIQPSTPTIPLTAGTLLTTTQNGSAEYMAVGGNGSYSFGATDQVFEFDALLPGTKTEVYFRNVGAVNSSVVFDDVRSLGGGGGEGTEAGVGVEWGEEGKIGEAVVYGRGVEGLGGVAGKSVREVLGRGPG